MDTNKDLRNAAQQVRDPERISLGVDGVSFRIYEGKPLQFNVTVKGNRFPTIKFEERTFGKFTVAVALEDGGSIDYTQAKVFTMDEPLEHLAAAFPQSADMRRLVNCLVNSH